MGASEASPYKKERNLLEFFLELISIERYGDDNKMTLKNLVKKFLKSRDFRERMFGQKLKKEVYKLTR